MSAPEAQRGAEDGTGGAFAAPVPRVPHRGAGAARRRLGTALRRHVGVVAALAAALGGRGAEGLNLGTIVAGFRRGSAPTNLRDANGVAIAANGDVLVADTGNHRVQRCTASAKCTTVAGGEQGNGASQLFSPYAVAVTADNRVLVVDTQNHRIQRWDPGAAAGVTVAGGGSELSFPAGIAVDAGRRQIYVADTGRQRIQRYQLDASYGPQGGGVTVAGVDKAAGDETDLTKLNNPTAVLFDTKNDRLYVADARNKRVLSWPFDSLSGSEGKVEINGAKGRPYGLAMSDDMLLYSDYDECSVWKRLGDGEIVVAAGGSCGYGLSQLSLSAGIATTPNGAIYVADVGNSRVLRFGPEPAKRDVYCFMSQDCKFTTNEGNALKDNLVAIVSAKSGSCGGTCAVGGLSGSTWSDYRRPKPPYGRTSDFELGVPMLGDLGEYLICWGANVADTAPIAKGNCSSVPYTIGRLYLNAYVDVDVFASRPRSQCARGAFCAINLEGYSIPNGTTILAAPESGFGVPAYTCRDIAGSTFAGYREFVLTNPGVTPFVRWPLEEQGDLTTNVLMDMGQALGMGSRHLCLCYGGLACNQPSRFKLDVGMMIIRSALGEELFTCQMGTGADCKISVRGKYLLGNDTIAIARIDQECRTIFDSPTGVPHLQTMPFQTPLAKAVAVTSVNGTVPGEDWVAEFNIGQVYFDGRYKVCYCASLDASDVKDIVCDDGTEFSQDAGILEIFRILPAQFECALGRPCWMSAQGPRLLATDRALVDFGGPEICGTVGLREDNGTGNVFAPLNAVEGRNYTDFTFYLRSFPVAGQWYSCYCATFDNNDQFTCNYELEYYQEHASLIVRGPTVQVLPCVQAQNCTVQVEGFGLSADDRVQICPFNETHPCSHGELCARVGPEARTGLLSPASSTENATSFDFGVVPIGSYSLCYCATGRNASHPSAISCGAAADLTMGAGELNVRGATPGQIHSCVEGSACAFVVTGHGLASTDHVLLAPLDEACGNTTGLPNGTFIPSSLMQTSQEGTSTIARSFSFDLASEGGRFRVCYCVYASCVNNTDFVIDGGLLFVKGLTDRPKEARCKLGETCTIRTQGFGLNEMNDSVILVPQALGCGGAFVRVRGDRAPTLETVRIVNATHNFTVQRLSNMTLNGTYRRLPDLNEGRVQFRSQVYNQLLYYNTYWSRWILGPRKDPDIPQEVGFAWVDGFEAHYPDRFTQLPWKIWNTTTTAWTDWPALEVYGAVAPPGTFAQNPSNMLSGKVQDPVLGFPYVLEETFDVGLASTKGIFKICFCPSSDLADKDEQTCSSEEEHFALDGYLAVDTVRGEERYHCALNGACTLRTALSGYDDKSSLHMILLPGDMRCFQASEVGHVGWASANNISGSIVDGELVFDLGTAMTAGNFQVCVCTDYDIDLDGTPCDKLTEFYENIGALTVAPFVRRSFTAGNVIKLNLTLGSGLAATDSLELVSADNCLGAAGVGPRIVTPTEVAADGSWALFPLTDDSGAGSLGSGSVSLCLCASFDGSDAGEVACSRGAEFSALVGRVTVSVVVPPTLSTFVTSAIEFELEFGKATARRLAEAWSEAISLTRLQFVALFEAAMAQAVTSTLGIASIGLNSSAMDVTLRTMATSESVATDGARLLKAEVSFGVQYTATPVQLMWSTCPDPYVLAHLQSVDSNPLPSPTAAQFRQCIALPKAFDILGANLMVQFRSALLQEAALKGLSILNVQTVKLDPADGLSSAYKPPGFTCAQGSQCRTTVFATRPALRGGAVLALKGAGTLCGALGVDAGNVEATSRAPPGFDDVGGIVRLPSLDGNVDQMAVDWGKVTEAGWFTLCYCQAPAAADCVYDKQFDQTAGWLLVRGVTEPQPTECVAWAPCNSTAYGYGLSTLDHLVAIPENHTCGSEGALVEPSIATNPAANPVVPLFQEYWAARRFSMNVGVKVGSYRMCYCPANDGSFEGLPTVRMPCTSISHHSADAGILWMRGVDYADFAFSAARADEAVAPATFQIFGLGLLPGFDQVLMVAWEAGSCGAGAAVSEDLAPNPLQVSAVSAMTTWATGNGTENVSFLLVQATKVGRYRICFCTDSMITPCQDIRMYLHQAGVLTVRGATGRQSWMCREGLPCSIEVSGVQLSTADRIALVPPQITCGFGDLSLQLAAGNPFDVSSVNNETSAIFQVGALVVTGVPMSYRVCYCANLSASGSGAPCTNATDFSHSAGLINTVLCPSAPSFKDFVPPVEDVFRVVGLDDPHLRFWHVQALACLQGEEKSKSELDPFNEAFPDDGSTSSNVSVHISTASHRCNSSVFAKTASLNSVLYSGLDMEFLDAQGSRARLPVNLARGPGLRVTPYVTDTQLATLVCPSWQIRYVAFACDWTGALLYGILLHLSFMSAGFLLFVNLGIELLGKFVQRLQNRLGRGAKRTKAPQKKRKRQGFIAGLVRDIASLLVRYGRKAWVALATRSVSTWRRLDKTFAEEDPSRPEGDSATTLALPQLSATGAADEEGKAKRGDLVMGMLLGTTTLLFLASSRIAILIGHVAVLWFADVGDLGFLSLIVVPFIAIIAAASVQLLVIAATGGREGLVEALRPGMPMFYSLIAVSKMHLDISLSQLLRKHHCEAWRLALVLYIVLVTVQLVLPIFAFFEYMLPPRRTVSLSTRRAAVKVMEFYERQRELPEPVQLASTAAKAATAASPVRGDHDDDDAKVRERLRDQGFVAMGSADSIREIREAAKPTRCTRFHLWLTALRLRLRWNAFLLRAPFRAAPPEALQRRRLIGLYMFMDASGWHIATTMTRDVIQRSTGQELHPLEARLAVFSIIFGGLDLATLHAYLLIFYYSRLSLVESLMLGISLTVGVLQVARPNIGRAAVELAARWARKERFEDAAGWFCVFLLLRTLQAAPVSLGCPTALVVWAGMSASVLFLELPLLVYLYPRLYPQLFDKRLRAHRTSAQMAWDIIKNRCCCCCRAGRRRSGSIAAARAGADSPAKSIGDMSPGSPQAAVATFNPAAELPSVDVLKYPGSEPMITALFRLIEALSEDIRPAALEDGDAPLRQVQRAVSRLFYERPEKYGLGLREERLFDACLALRSAADLLSEEGRPCRMAYDELRQLCDAEFRTVRMMARSRLLANSYHFKSSTLASRAEAIASSLPEAPMLWLVHWRTLRSLGRLPDAGEKEFLTLATSAFAQYGAKAVLVPVIHRARSPIDPDPHRVSCRQLVTFAHWYRSRWGTGLEPFYWIDSCCVPDLAGADDSGAPDSFKASPVSVLNPVAQRGLRTLPAWLEDQPEVAEDAAADTEVVSMLQGGAASSPSEPEEAMVTQAGADAMLPALYAAADAVVVCESRGFERSAWVRTHMALAFAFSPSGSHIYLVDRQLIHVPRHIRHPVEPDCPPLMATSNCSALDGLRPYSPQSAWEEKEAGPSRDLRELLDDWGASGDEFFNHSGQGFHTVAGSTGASFFSDRPNAARELALSSVARMQLLCLQDPTDWANVQLDRPEHARGRISRLTAMCRDFPTLVTTGGLRRPVLHIGETCARLCRVEPLHSKRKRRSLPDGVPEPPRSRADGVAEESSDESSADDLRAEPYDDDLDGRAGKQAAYRREVPDAALKAQSMYHALTKPGDMSGVAPVFAFAETTQKAARSTTSWRVSTGKARDPFAIGEDASTPGVSASTVEMLLRRAADPGPAPTIGGAILRPLPLPRGHAPLDLRFHETFRPRTVSIGAGGSTAEQLRPASEGEVKEGTAGHLPSGGMVILSRPLAPRSGVAPDVLAAKGLSFSVTVEVCDSAWGDGLGIGFTTQDPDRWPSTKTRPRYASTLPNACLCGYSGQWVINGSSQILRKVRGNSVSWTPKSLRRGDVITAVLAAPPADVFRVLVNGRIVAERSASDLPDALSGSVWGVLDVDGCCVKVRLGEGIPESSLVDLSDLARPATGGPPRPRTGRS